MLRGQARHRAKGLPAQNPSHLLGTITAPILQPRKLRLCETLVDSEIQAQVCLISEPVLLILAISALLCQVLTWGPISRVWFLTDSAIGKGKSEGRGCPRRPCARRRNWLTLKPEGSGEHVGLQVTLRLENQLSHVTLSGSLV